MIREEAKLNLEWVHTDRATVYSNIDKIYYDFEAQLKAKDAEIALLKQCVEEAIKRPMGVEPSLYSDYKMLKDKK